MDLLNSHWVPVTQIPPGKRPKWREWNDAPVFKDLPSGRLTLRAYAPGLAWQQEWRERKAGALPKKLRAVVRELAEAIPRIQELQAEADREAEIRHCEWKEQQRRWRKEEAERRRPEAFKAGREQLMAIIDEWALATRVEAFCTDIERRLPSREGTERDEMPLRLEPPVGCWAGRMHWSGSGDGSRRESD